MYTLSSNVTITDPAGNTYLDKLPVIELKIKKSRKTLTNTASITLPRNIKVLNGDINTIIKRGAAVSIQLGYDGNLVTRFTGFVASVSATIPLTIECQDSMWALKQNSFTKTWPKGTRVVDIISYIYPGLAVVADLQIGGLAAIRQSTAQILASLKKYGLQCYFGADVFGNNTLYVDFAGALHSSGNNINYDMYRNVIENNLAFKLKEDLQILVVGISNLDNGQKLQVTAGDNAGEKHTLNYYNMAIDELQKIVNSEIAALQYDGFKGNFKTFGLPEIEPGDTAVISNPLYPEQNGSYLTESVVITFGIGGYRHEPVLERKLA